jgi:hypothetical protein
VPRPAGAVTRAEPLRHDAFEPELASVAKHDVAGQVYMLVEPASQRALRSRVASLPLARLTPEVWAFDRSKAGLSIEFLGTPTGLKEVRADISFQSREPAPLSRQHWQIHATGPGESLKKYQ